MNPPGGAFLPQCRHIFGPVPSRRLGLSLGVDLTPFKTCSLDCVYCQLGITTIKTIERREFFPQGEILDELQTVLSSVNKPDYITFSGSGEPTLHSGLGKLIQAIKHMTGIPVCVITNGSLLWMPDVRADLARADIVIPSLDAGDEETFVRVNRPHSGITFDMLLEGLIRFRKEYCGQIWLEVFLVRGITDTPEQVRRIAAEVSRIAPDRVQINTAVRPAAEHSVQPVPRDVLVSLLPLFGPGAEIIADYPSHETSEHKSASDQDVLELLARHPGTAMDVVQGLGITPQEADMILTALIARGCIIPEMVNGNQFYRKMEQAFPPCDDHPQEQ